MVDGLVSIIVPIYNVKPYLKRCIDSLISQTYSNMEIIMIDDCSTDGSKTIAEQYSSTYPFCKLLSHKQNKGLAGSRNSGVKKAEGEWLFFVDSDDWIHADTLKLLVSNAKKYNSDIVMCGYCYAWDNNEIKIIDSFKGISSESSQKDKIALVPQPSATRRLYRSDFFLEKDFDFPEDIKRGEDFPLTIPLLTYTSKITIVNEPLYFYYQRKGSISNINKIDDFSFYDKIIKVTNERVNKGFEKEIEYRYILELVYSKTLLMIKSKYKNSEIKSHLTAFDKEYNGWIYNPYLKKCNRMKLFFIKNACKKNINILKVLVFAWDRRRLIK